MRALSAEVRKLTTLRGARLTVVLTLAATLALAYASGRANADSGLLLSQVAGWAMMYAQAGFVVLGALAAASEYLGGQHRTTLLAMPRRLPQAAAKLVALLLAAVTMAVLVQATSLLGYWLGLGSQGIADAAELTRNLLGSGLVGVLLALLAWGIGLATRSAIAAMVPLLGICLFVAPLLLRYVAWAKYLPGNAGSTLIISGDGLGSGMGLPGQLGPTAGGLVLAGWAVAAAAAAVTSYLWRDA